MREEFAKGRPTERVRRFLRAKRKWWAVPEIAEATWLHKKQVRLILKDMLKRGEVERKPHPGVLRGHEKFVYRHTGKETRWGGGYREPEISRRIFRAMHVKGVFSAREIALLAGANIATVRWLIRTLRDELEEVGRRVSPRGALEKLWRIRHRDRFYQKHVLQVAAKAAPTKKEVGK